MRRLSLACLLATLLAARAAAAGTTIVFHEANGGTVTWYAQGTRVRLQNFDGNNEDLGVIFDLPTRNMVFVADDKQVFWDVARYIKNRRDVAAALKRGADHGAPPPKVMYVPSKEKRKVSGFDCEMFQGFVEGRVVKEICAVPWGGKIGVARNYDAFKEAVGIMDNPAGPKGKKSAPSPWEDMPGMPIWQQEIGADRSRGPVREIETLKFCELPAAIFSVPAGYVEVEEPPLGPAKRAPKVAPGPARARTPATRTGGDGRVFAVVVVMMLGLGLAVLLFHAFLVHLAAGLVLKESRYTDALVATLVAWVVAVPMQVLAAPFALAVPVEIAAIYAGLKVSYRASTGRTIALLIVSLIIATFVSIAFAFMNGAFRPKP